MSNNKRVSALQRLGQASPLNNAAVNDARELLSQRNKPTFDARQLLSRQSSDEGKMVVVTGLKDMKLKDGRLVSSPLMEVDTAQKKKQIFSVGPSTFVTIRNASNRTALSSNQSTEKVSFTKTITNPLMASKTEAPRARTADEKVVISFVNDQYRTTPKQSNVVARSASPIVRPRDSAPPIIKRLHDASIQTSHASSSSRSPIRIHGHQRQMKRTIDEDEDDTNDDEHSQEEFYEPPVKRTSSSVRKTMQSHESSTGTVKRSSAGVPVSSRVTSAPSKQVSTSQSSSTPATLLVTNLQPSVTEEDVVELFGQIGSISQITTLSQGCLQIVFAKREHAEQAVSKYHNRLLDGQFMYVSLQQTPAAPAPAPAKPASVVSKSSSKTSTSNPQPTAKDAGSSTTNQPLKFNANQTQHSAKISIDPAFMRQALFHPTNNTSNPVQFQVKL